jgi:hypothetical protein
MGVLSCCDLIFSRGRVRVRIRVRECNQPAIAVTWRATVQVCWVNPSP